VQQLLDIKCLAVILTSLVDDRVIEVNEKYLTTFGYTRKEVIGKTTTELNIWACPQDRETLVNMLSKDGKVENFASKLCAKTGQIITCRLFVEYGAFDGHKCIVGLVYDATEALCESEKKYRDIIGDAQIIIMNVDETGRILFINKFGSNFLGYQSSDLIGYSLKDTFLPEFESTGRNLWEYYKDLFDNSANYKKIVCEVTKKDGRRVWIEWMNCFQKDAVTGQASVVTVGIDITARRRAEALARTMYERRQRDKMLDDVIENRITEEEFFSIAEENGLQIAPPLVCCMVVLDCSDDRLKFLKKDLEEWQAWVDTAVDLIYARLGGLAWHTEHGIVILHHSSKKSRTRSFHDDATWVEKISNVIKDVFRGIHYMIGVSTIHTEIKTVYTQAYEAVRVGPVFHPEKYIHHWRDLGVNRLLIEQAKSTAGMAFIQDYLGPLLEKPSSRNKEWFMTLQEIISGDSMNAMAARLHIHPKTLAFRKIRIKRLLQLEIDDPEERLNIAVALKLKKLREKL
jgi:PAS domain S-box-containing protein